MKTPRGVRLAMVGACWPGWDTVRLGAILDHPRSNIKQSVSSDTLHLGIEDSLNLASELRRLLIRLNDKSDCKKFYKLEADTIAARNLAIRKLMLWCIRGKEFPRQRNHMWYTPKESELPPAAFLQARRLDEGPLPIRRSDRRRIGRGRD